jgi:large subunit ribosomal protein L35
MPKLKTHSGMKKRVKRSGSGKLLRRHAFRNHFLSKKSHSRRRQYGKDFEINKSDERSIKRMLGK